MKLDIGCGTRKAGPDWTGVDKIAFDGVDIVLDVAARHGDGKAFGGGTTPFKPWPWDDNSVDEIHCSHFLEHLYPDERIHFANEVFRILKPGAKATIYVPWWASQRSYGDMTHCLADDSEALTETGWKLIKDVRVGERVFTLDLVTEKATYAPVSAVINEPYVGTMLHFKTDCLDLMVTPNHDMIWRNKDNNPRYWARRGKEPPHPCLHRSAADSFLRLGGHHPRRGTAVMDWTGAHPERIRVAEDELSLGRILPGEFDAEAIVALIGWYVAEGHVDLSSKNHYRISIAQSSAVNPDKVKRICAVIDKLGFKPTVKHDQVVFSSKALALYLHPLGLAPVKRIPAEIKQLSADLLRILIQSAVLGDGTQNGTGWTYATTSYALANDMQEIALKAGYRTSLRTEARQGTARVINGHQYVTNHDMHMVGIYSSKDLWYPIPVPVPYSGRQVCLSVPGHQTFLARRGGSPIWVGNCWPPVVFFWTYYLMKSWRAANAPHNTEYTCDFDATGGTVPNNSDGKFNGRSDAFVQEAMRDNIEGASDLIFTLVKPLQPR